MMADDSRAAYLASIEAAVGGAYHMGDGRDFWMDGVVAREVARRAAEGVGAWARRHEPGSPVDLQARLAAAEAKGHEWALALQSLTPGGSEYVDDPARCVGFVRETRESQHQAIDPRMGYIVVQVGREALADVVALLLAKRGG
jgi:hypothetical protein